MRHVEAIRRGGASIQGGGETSGEAKPAARSTAPLFQWPEEEGDPKVGFAISKNSRGLTEK